ncbi:3-phenylpropionate MFS transporter [Dickeya dianthicola]|uniref:3-phenylpropionate MFS transporter n=1 Tax=Dickeya dianthicola TaxID=204039 RepID=A0AAW4LI47_9GAMM|nr:3-phenylpropionate MFS transporter [Dickeya dianthicola]ATO34175.1 putative 3-phenylpropionic acid transporter [Dickeya dianthicola RNS04.9]MBT1429097.1 3-phenylpropionate MFS transporter [Dickeya dianthicola]MBT1433124.1 3-phenylpropionate MFS transporter [Dickeya dianthicola]MBT1460612.1 3-phenylpropionate MFS transporter [Dickeya dianthicola]MBT1489809.1 3-phenylpropionate MFS transporter [Dickeya dianthicola]
MVLQSTYWLALGYFTYFFSYGIFLPFWGGWLKGEGLPAEAIGILLGIGLVARFAGSLFITPLVKDPARLITVLRLLALLSLLTSIGFWLGSAWLWLMLVMIGFNLFFAPLIPLTDALAATWQKQITLDYGRVRVWGSVAFVIGSAVTGQLVVVWGHQAILAILAAGLLSMLLGMALQPHVMPASVKRHQTQTAATPWRVLLREPAVWRFLLSVSLLQGAHAAYYGFSVIYWQQAGYSAAVIGYLWSLGVVAEIVIFALSKRLFRHWSASGLLMLSALCGVVRWSLMGATVSLPWLIVIQILHCGTFTVCHLAAMRFISSRNDADVLRLQAAYSALGTGGAVAVMTVVSGFLFEYLQGGTFWVMALLVLPAFVLRPQVSTRSR